MQVTLAKCTDKVTAIRIQLEMSYQHNLRTWITPERNGTWAVKCTEGTYKLTFGCLPKTAL